MVPPASDRIPRVLPYSGSHSPSLIFRLRGSHPLRLTFPCHSTRLALMLSWSFNPVPKNGLGCFPFARRYSGNHFCFLFLRVLRCFSSPSSSRDTYVFGIRCHPSWMTGSPIRISADLCFLTAPRSVSPFGASFFSPRWPGIHRTPFPT